jgi:hypothetical protein
MQNDNDKENEHLLDDVRLHSSFRCLHPGLPDAAQPRRHWDGGTARGGASSPLPPFRVVIRA